MHSSSQFSCNLALWRSLCRGRSAPASSSSPLSGPRLPSFTRGRPYGKRSSSSSRSGGCKRFCGGKGGGLLLPDLRVSEVGAISFPHPFWRLSVPPLAGPEGQGCGALGCRGAEGGLLSALPQHSSSFQCSHPNAFLQPHLHHGGCSVGGPLGLNCQDLEAPVYASMVCLRDLLWWLHLPRLSLGVSLCQVSPDLPSGQTPQTRGGVPISIVRSLQACGTPNRRRYP